MKCICNKLYRWAARYDETNTHSIKILLCRLAHGEVLPSDEANVSEDVAVSLRYFTQSCWAQWQSYETLKGRSLLNLCIPLPYRLYSYLRNIQITGPVGNSCYQAGKPVTLSLRGIVQLENEMWFLIIKNVNRWCYQVLLKDIRGSPFSSGLPHGALFTQILCNSSFRLCALNNISAYLTRTVETKTTRVSNDCHSIRTVLVVRWHHIRVRALR